MGEENRESVAQTVSEGIKYEFLDDFLVKPLDPIKVKKEFNTPVTKDVTSDDGMEVSEYDDVATEVKEVDSDYREGIVLKVPSKYQTWMNDEKFPAKAINIGDKVVYRATNRYFDLFKDSILLKPHEIIAIVPND